MTRKIWLLGSAALFALTATAHAQVGAAQAQLDDIRRQVEALNAQVEALQKAQTQSGTSAALADLKRSSADQYADISKRIAAQPKLALDNGRLTVTSADGDFSIALRALVQLDIGYFAQGKNPPGIDLNSGTNFRRAQLGFQGIVFHDWSYNFTYDFGGNGVEGRGYVYTGYLEYDGLKPLFLRVGAFSPFEGIDDQTGSGDLFFTERASASDIARSIAGAPGREGASIWLQEDRYLLALSFTGKKTTDGVATFDAQQALIARAAVLAVSTPQFKWLVDGHITQVLKLADPVPSPSSSDSVIRFSNGPEVAVDASRTVDTGSLDAKRAREFGFETAASYGPLYGQGGWFHFDAERRTALPDPHFTGWYGFLAYALTGEQHSYDPTTASFRNLKPAHPLGSPGGWGAWELAARFSDVDLNFRPFAATAAGGVPGGKQDVTTLGLNWYPNNALKFQLDVSDLKVSHPNVTADDISGQSIVLRSQISL